VSDETPFWRSLPPEKLERQYNPRAAVPDFARYFAERQAASAAARSRIGSGALLRYGEGVRDAIDLFIATDNGPVFAFVHGGAWRAGDRSHYHFIVEPLHAAGISVALIGYELAPQADLGEMVSSVRAAVLHLRAELDRRGFDGTPLVLGGHSAGAHLAAMALAAPQTAAVVKAACLVSGLFDLAPVARTSINDDVHITATDIALFSPMRLPILASAPLLLAVGAEETEGFHEQTESYAAWCRRQGRSARTFVVPREHHFSIAAQFGDARAPLFSEIIQLCRKQAPTRRETLIGSAGASDRNGRSAPTPPD
jgi:arylformamidase